MDYQVWMSHCLFLPSLTPALDFATTRYLRQKSPAHRESHFPAFKSRGLTDGQESADLALLNGMYHTADAGYRFGNREGCLRGTRKGVLWEIERWLTNEREQRIFWLNGLAGTGKSTIAQTFAETSFADRKLGASFFCSRDFNDRSNLQAIFPTLAFQLAYRYPLFRKELLQVLKANPDVGQESLCSQMETLIVGPLKTTHIPTLIIIDALDECKDEQPASAILSILSRYVNEIPTVKFFITGRPEARIRTGFRLRPLLPITEVFKLHEVKAEAVDSDIKLFFQTQLANIIENRSDCSATGDWPSSFDIDILCKKAAGFFIYASTVIKFIALENSVPTQRLALITSLPESTVEEGRSGIDQLYTKVLEQAFHKIHANNSQHYLYFRTVVGTILLILNPLPIKALSELLGYDIPHIHSTIRSLHSLLLIPDKLEKSICTFHKSFPDFLTDPERCQDKNFLVEPAVHHAEILLSCLSLMRARLKKNICNLDDHAILSEVKDLSARKRDYIGDALEYACRFWTKHLLGIPGTSAHVKEVQKAIDTFFTTCLPYWIEVLALTGNLEVGVYAINEIEQWYALVSAAQSVHWDLCLYFVQTGSLCQWTADSQRLILEYFDTINVSPSHIYCSALKFPPSSSWLHQYYGVGLPQGVRVVRGLSAGWGTCFRTVQFDGGTLVVACWKDTIAVGLKSGQIITLSAITGGKIAVLSGHTEGVPSLTFSPDGASLVSGSYDKTIKLWDIQTGGVVKTFQGHTNYVMSVSISPNCTMIASACLNKTIRLWDIQTGKCHCVIQQENFVEYVHFFPLDPHHFISITDDGKVQEWNIDGYKTAPEYDGSCAAFSFDGTKLVSCNGGVAQVQSSNSGEVVAEFYMDNTNTKCCCFSPDGWLVAIAADDIVYIWDITNSEPCLIETFIGHTGRIVSLIFSSSSSLISASQDSSVRFWQIGASSTSSDATDPKSTPHTSPIKSITLQAKDGIAISTDSGGVVRIWDLSTGLCKASFHIPAKGSWLGDARLINNRLILVWYAAEKIHIWDVEKGGLLQTVDAPWGEVLDLRISGDGSKIFCMEWNFIHAWYIWTGEVIGKVGLPDVHIVDTFLTIDGPIVWTHLPDNIEGWDFEVSDSSSIKHYIGPPNRPHLDFVGGIRMVRSHLPGIEDTISGKEVFQLPLRYKKPNDAQWDGQYLVAGYYTGEVIIVECNCTLAH